MRLKTKFPLINIAYQALISYPTPINITYFWNFGIYALVCLVIQIITGLALAMHYSPNIDLAFISVEHIMRDVNYGWLIRYIHANGASMFFITVYIHTFRGIYFGSFLHPRQLLWVVGVAILLCMIITAFMGYVLPWGQMSFWGATVITNLFSAIPLFGTNLVEWLWGGPSVDNATLTRFYSLHFFLPFIIATLVLIHLFLLHLTGSNNPLGVSFGSDGGTTMSPFYLIKDLYGLLVFLIFFCVFLFFAPNLLGHPDNYIPANPLVTPPHIVPEWYFLPFYAILRSIPDKLCGVLALALAIISLFLIPFLHFPEVRSMRWRPSSRFTFWYFVLACVLLGWLGSKPIEYPYLPLGQLLTLIYFAYFYFITPITILFERFAWSHFFSKEKKKFVFITKMPLPQVPFADILKLRLKVLIRLFRRQYVFVKRNLFPQTHPLFAHASLIVHKVPLIKAIKSKAVVMNLTFWINIFDKYNKERLDIIQNLETIFNELDKEKDPKKRNFHKLYWTFSFIYAERKMLHDIATIYNVLENGEFYFAKKQKLLKDYINNKKSN